MERADFVCEYCKVSALVFTSPAECDHVDPSSRGGADEFSNLALSCGFCNGIKSNKTEGVDPDTQQTAAIFNPRKQLWKEHFSWTDDFILIRGITATGRVTVEQLQLNRESNQIIRRFMLGQGHPPLNSI